MHLVASRRCREYEKKLPISSWSKEFGSALHQDPKIGWSLSKKRGFWFCFLVPFSSFLGSGGGFYQYEEENNLCMCTVGKGGSDGDIW